jgi:hypothetical protein
MFGTLLCSDEKKKAMESPQVCPDLEDLHSKKLETFFRLLQMSLYRAANHQVMNPQQQGVR